MKSLRIALLLSSITIAFPSFFAHPQQNVVFIILDACRDDCLDTTRSGIPLTPFLSSFPATRFREASSAASWTRPSVASIFTGTHVDTHQIHELSRVLPESFETMAEYLKSAGYATLGIQTNGVASADWGFAQGFDQYIFNSFAPADWVTTTALSLASGASTPFFLFLHYNQTHVPYYPPVSYRVMMGYPNPGLTAYEQTIVEDFSPYQGDYLRYHLGLQPALTYEQLSPLGRDAARALYDGEVRFSDDQLAILINNILIAHPNTIVIVTADHGEHFWEHTSLGHATTAYEELVKVPLLIRIPGMPASSVDAVVSLVDLLPTLANALGLPVRAHWEGQDMFGVRDPAGPAYATAKFNADWLIDLESIRLGDMKLIREYKTGKTELYDLSSDPGEMINLVNDQPVVAQTLTTMLHQHLLGNARANGADSVINAYPTSILEEGRSIRLTAPDGTGHVWFKDGTPLLEDSVRITGVNSKTLDFSTLIMSDTGIYECIYSDEAFSLNVTNPYIVNVLEVDSVPAYNEGGLLLLVFLLIAVVSRYYKGSSKIYQ